MTRDEQRMACIKVMKNAFVTKFIGLSQDELADDPDLLCMIAAFDAPHGIVTICPHPPTEEMINAEDEEELKIVMMIGDLTNPPEEKP